MQVGDFDDDKSPAALLQENSPDATCMSIPYAPGRFAMFMYASKLVTASVTDFFFYPSSYRRVTNRHGHWLC